MSALGQQRTFGRVAKENFLYLFGLWRSTYGYYARWPAKNFAIGIIKIAVTQARIMLIEMEREGKG